MESSVKNVIGLMDKEDLDQFIIAIDNDINILSKQQADYWKVYASLLECKVLAYQRLMALGSED